VDDIQVEAGNYTRIHNKILEQLARTKLNGKEYACLLFLFRKTYGFQRKDDSISYEQWQQGAGFSKRHHAYKVVSRLVDRHILYAVDNGQYRPKTYGFNKRFDEWDSDTITKESVTPQGNRSVTQEGNTFAPSVTPQGNRSVTPQGNRSVTPQGNNKRKKERKESSSGGGDDASYSRLVAIHENEFGLLTAYTAETLGDLLDEYGEQWVGDAMRRASLNGKRNLNYATGILRRWHADGKDWPAAGNTDRATVEVPEGFRLAEVMHD